MRAIFLSYRRDDAEGEAGRLFDFLTAEFGADNVFMDVAGIEPGRDFRKVIDQNVTSCGVLLAMIGKGWLDAKDDAGRPRLDDPMDFVRLETASALKRDIPVIPVLVHEIDTSPLGFRCSAIDQSAAPPCGQRARASGRSRSQANAGKAIRQERNPRLQTTRSEQRNITSLAKRFWRRVILAGVAATAIAAGNRF